MATVKANGYTHIPAPVEGYEAGTELEVMLTTDPGSIERTLILTGIARSGPGGTCGPCP